MPRFLEQEEEEIRSWRAAENGDSAREVYPEFSFNLGDPDVASLED